MFAYADGYGKLAPMRKVAPLTIPVPLADRRLIVARA